MADPRNMSEARIQELAAQWGLPMGLGDAAEMIAAIQRIDATLDVLFPQQREIMAALDRGEIEDADRAAAFVMGLHQQTLSLLTFVAGDDEIPQ